MNEREKTAIKENAIRMADHHRKHCDGRGCDISLHLLKRALDLAGIELSHNEQLKFL